MEKNSYYWVYTTTLFTNSLTEDSQSLPKVGIITTFYTWATGGLERLEPAQQSPRWEVWRASYDPSLLLPEPQLLALDPSGWRWHFRTLKIRTDKNLIQT